MVSASSASPTKLGDLNGDGVLDVFDLTVLRQHIRQVAPIAENMKPFADVNGDGFLNEDDAVALINIIVGKNSAKVLPLASIRETSPFAGESGVALTREVVLRFTMPLSVNASLTTWDANTQTAGDLYAEAGGRKLLTRVELSGDRRKASLFFLEPVPASTRVTVTFDGVGLNDLLERQIDPVGDNLATGGVFTFTYDTAPITAVPGTGIIGHVYASERGAGGADVPLEHVLVRVVGSETLFTFTAADGSFSLNPCPAGRFFVEVDGRESGGRHFYDDPPGAYYPYINKPWEALPGRADNLAAGTGVIYLPLIPAGTLQPVSPMVETVVKFAPSVVAANPALAGVEITVPPNSLFADDGTRGGRVGLAPVASDRLPEPLPPGLHHALDISIQTDGATNFDRPVPVKFPNLPDPVTGVKLKPGEKSALWSYNHDKGTWEFGGPMTVTDDGNFVVTDVGVGVRQPGWHGVMPGAPAEPEPPLQCPFPSLSRSSPASAKSAAAPDCCGGASIAAAAAATPASPLDGLMLCRPKDGCKDPPPADDGSNGEGIYRKFFRCLQRKVCAAPNRPDGTPTFPKFIMDELATQGWRVSSKQSPIVGPFRDFRSTIHLGGDHTFFELMPTFQKYAERLIQQDDWRERFRQWDDDHEDFLNNITEPCGEEVGLPPGLGQNFGQGVHAIGTVLRRISQDLAIRRFRSTEVPPLFSGKAPSRVRSGRSIASLNTASNPLRVTLPGGDAARVGTALQFKVERLQSDGSYLDVTQASAGTVYAPYVTEEFVRVSADGMISLLSSAIPFSNVTTPILVFVLNGDDIANFTLSVTDLDSDGDGLVDSYETRVGLSPTVPNPADSDIDGDGISDFDEARYGTSPIKADSDGDGLSDYTEIGLRSGDSNPVLPALEPVDGELLYAIRVPESGIVLRGKMRGGSFDKGVFLELNKLLELVVLNPTNGSVGRTFIRTPLQPQVLKIPHVVLNGNGLVDSDNDGLSDDAEFVVGTDLNNPDSDGDGVLDGAEVAQGSNPLDNHATQTGALSTIDTPGQAKDIAAQNTVALLADGSEGVSVFNVANALNPVRTAQVRLTGSTEAVALDGTLAAATGSSLSLLDLSDLSAVRVTKQLFLGGTPRAVTAAGGVAYAGLDNGQVVAVDMAAGAELERLQVSTEPIHDLSFAGDVLYARSASRVLAIEFAPAGMTVAGSVAVPGSSAARQRLFAGVGVIYAPKEDGYTILSLADPLHPAAAQTITVAQRGWRQFVPTGSGLGLGIFTNFAAANLHLYDIGANGTGSQFLTTFTTPGDSQAVSIYNGLAYVADGEAGLTVVNYKAYDALGVPPTISIGTGFPTVSGALQAEEGKLGRVTAQVADDVQVRNVEFYVDGQLAVADGNFPFEHRFTTPLLAAGKTSFTLRAKATDTGGNSTWSATLTVNLVADATPPRVVKFLPPTGSFTGSIRAIAATFSEPIDPATLTAASFAITGAGPDGVFGSADDLTPAGGAISYREASNAAFVTFPQDLAPSLYRLVVRPPIADLAGNPIAAPAQTQFRVFSFTDSDGDGIPDDVEPLLGLDPHNPDTDGNGIRDGNEDFDHDHLTNAQEIALGLDPRNAHSNGNPNVLDGDADPDGDKLSNAREALAGTDPNKADTDGDGFSDEAEVTGGSNPLDPRSRPIGLVSATPPTNVLRVNGSTSGRGAIQAAPPVYAVRLGTAVGESGGGFGPASIIATPQVTTVRFGFDGTQLGGRSVIQALPTVFAVRLAAPQSGTNGEGASIIATPSVNAERSSGTPVSTPPVTIKIQ